MDKTYYIVRNRRTGSTLKGYGAGYSSPPKLYKSYGYAQAQVNCMYVWDQDEYEVVPVVISPVSDVS